MADKSSFNQLCAEWFKGDMSDKRNPLQRALALNNDQIIAGIKAGSADGSWPTPSWSKLFKLMSTAFKEAEKAGEQGNHYLDWLKGEGKLSQITTVFMFQITGPLMKHLTVVGGPNMKNPPLSARTALLALGAITRTSIHVVDVQGTKAEFITALAKRIQQASAKTNKGKTIGITTIEKAVRTTINRMEEQGINLQGGTKQSWLLGIDEDALDEVSDALGKPRFIKGGKLKTYEKSLELSTAIRTPEQLHQASEGLFSSTSNRLAVLNVILQGWSIWSATQAEKTTLNHATEEAKHKIWSMYGGLFGSIVENTAGIMQKQPKLTMALEAGAEWATVKNTRLNWMKWGGRVLGALAGAVMVIYDGMHAWEAKKEGNWDLTILYGASSIVGLLLIASVFWSAITGGMVFALIIIAIALGMFIDAVKDNPVQEWLKRCLWGKEGDQYKRSELTKSIDYEQTELAKAMGIILGQQEVSGTIRPAGT